MNQLERKINQFIKKYQNLATLLSIPILIIGSLVHSILCLFLVTILCGFPILFRAYLALKQKIVSIELLVTIATIGALFIHEYHECAMVTFLFQIGNYLELHTLRKTRNAIKELVELAPTIAYKKEGNEIIEIDVDDIEEGDELIVKEGGKVAVDGIITQYTGYFNEASITGESELAHKSVNDLVYAGTILTAGFVEMKATRVGEDTTYSKIVELVEEAQDAKSPIEKVVDCFAKYYTPFVIVMASITLLITRNIDTSITVLVLACPGALVIGAPVANVAGIGKGAREGILFKGGDVIHTFSKSQLFIFDKTGTLTNGKAEVSSIYYYDDPKYLKIAANIENQCTHPLGKAIIQYAKVSSFDPDIKVDVIKGKGVQAKIEQEMIYIGNESLLNDHLITFTKEQINHIESIKEKGESLVLVGGKQLYLALGITDTLREDAVQSMLKLKKYGKLVMLTGDHIDIASRVGKQLGFDEVYASLLPEQKYEILSTLQKDHTICFIGDGINDSPSITKADTGIAMGSGTDIAIECSDLVLLNSKLGNIVEALKIAKKTVLVTYENMFIAIGTVFLLLIGLFLNYIHMSSGMLIHEGSILVVIINAMRLLIRKGKRK